MANFPLAVNIDLARIEANVRSQAQALNVETSELFPEQLHDIIYNALVSVRNFFGKFLDEFYYTEPTAVSSSTFSSGGNSYTIVNLTSFNVADVNRVGLRDATYGKIDIVSFDVWSDLQQLYGATKLANAVFGCVMTTLLNTTPDTGLAVRLFKGGSVASPLTNLLFSYFRVPKKATVYTEKLDIPDFFIPLVQDVAVLYVFEKLKMLPPGSFSQRVGDGFRSLMQQVGVNVSPNTENKTK